MKIQYAPNGINNFHNSADLPLVISGKTDADGYYIISAGQARKIARHFCAR